VVEESSLIAAAEKGADAGDRSLNLVIERYDDIWMDNTGSLDRSVGKKYDRQSY